MKPRKLRAAIPSLLLLAPPAGAEVIERVVAKVNGEIITLSDFEARQVASVQGARVQPADVEAYLRANNAKILQDSIDDLLVAQRGYDLGVRVKPEYLQEVIDGIKKENNFESDQVLQEQLRREGMSLDDLKRSIERSVLRRQALTREVESKITVTEAEARADYEARRAEFDRPAAVHLQEIVLAGSDEETADLARQIREKLAAGSDFAALAKVHSTAPTAASGGDLGWLKRGEMNAEIEKTAFALEPGALADPMPVAGGLRLIRLVEKTAGGLVPFDQARAEITRRLTQQRMEKSYDAYVEDLRKNALIEIKVREVPLQVTVTAPANPVAAPSAPESELSVIGQTGPERVVPPPPPGTKPEDAPPPPQP
jgi:peptidyl-prolyl cis-trans isomerase SurA